MYIGSVPLYSLHIFFNRENFKTNDCFILVIKINAWLARRFPLISRKMMASRGPPTAPPRRPFSSWGFVGILLVTPVLRLPTSTDACDDTPRYESRKPQGNPAPPFNAGFTVEYECRLGYRLIVTLVCPPLLVVSLITRGRLLPGDLYERIMSTTSRAVLILFLGKQTVGPFTHPCCTLQNVLSSVLPQGCLAFNTCFTPKSGPDGRFQFGSEARHSCNEGSYLLGSPVVHCELSGHAVAWSDEPPRCVKMFVSTTSTDTKRSIQQ